MLLSKQSILRLRKFATFAGRVTGWRDADLTNISMAAGHAQSTRIFGTQVYAQCVLDGALKWNGVISARRLREITGSACPSNGDGEENTTRLISLALASELRLRAGKRVETTPKAAIEHGTDSTRTPFDRDDWIFVGEVSGDSIATLQLGKISSCTLELSPKLLLFRCDWGLRRSKRDRELMTNAPDGFLQEMEIEVPRSVTGGSHPYGASIVLPASVLRALPKVHYRLYAAPASNTQTSTPPTVDEPYLMFISQSIGITIFAPVRTGTLSREERLKIHAESLRNRRRRSAAP